eukprot:CAMPEP_0170616504 /NCGR_PEP_ID=MMETSP0224-20130122/25904_1 /TAXON_ID=285029 /ORGANISM="Togula jolla, Strain CCCM 725" /LENGTH=334 /DNA_ID=CAMNT_0010942303 /DNA_START=22 /DNA_END=1026 /DNA_ORIENTATION=+
MSVLATAGWGEETPRHDVHTSLQGVLRWLDSAADESRVRQVLIQLLRDDLPARLIDWLSELEFEAKKDVTRLFGAILKLGSSSDSERQIFEYIRNHNRILEELLDGCGDPEVFLYCAQMLRSCALYPNLVKLLLDKGATSILMDLVRHENFDISSQAFASLRELLLTHKAVSSSYIEHHFKAFFERYNVLLQVEDYVTQRQALPLLAEMLLDRSFMRVMSSYIARAQYLQIHMNLLTDKSRCIRLAAFQLVKVFAANPYKTRPVHHILYKNKDRLQRVLMVLNDGGRMPESAASDIETVISLLQVLGSPPRERTLRTSSSAMKVRAYAVSPPMR